MIDETQLPGNVIEVHEPNLTKDNKILDSNRALFDTLRLLNTRLDSCPSFKITYTSIDASTLVVSSERTPSHGCNCKKSKSVDYDTETARYEASGSKSPGLVGLQMSEGLTTCTVQPPVFLHTLMKIDNLTTKGLQDNPSQSDPEDPDNHVQ